ncbi:YceD family protein [Desulfoscipio sp. XC116]|uniref:YceD family protein n=1 Tax=Desulfoscipio sp. XC116 TaxID=3144975 RepID=UPI00325A87C3
MPFLDVEQLKKANGERQRVVFTGELPALQVEDSEFVFVEPARFDLILTNVGSSAINVEGKLQVFLKVPCSRCLQDFVLNLNPLFSETYYEKNQPAPKGKNDEWVAYSGDRIDITPEVLGTVLMNLPMRFICHEQCRGLCPVCGVDLNQKQCNCVQNDLDPRLAKLKELLKS